MAIDLYYNDNNWKQRGEGMISNSVRVLRKVDLEEYVKDLEAEGFSRIS